MLHWSTAAEAAAPTTWEASSTSTWEASTGSSAWESAAPAESPATTSFGTFALCVPASEEIETVANMEHGVGSDGVHLTIRPAVSVDGT